MQRRVPARGPDGCQEAVEASGAIGRGQHGAIESGQRRVGVRESRELRPRLVEHGSGRSTVRDRLIGRLRDQLVVLDEPVVGDFGEGERGESQRVDDGELEERERRRAPRDERPVVTQDIVPGQELRSRGERIEAFPGARIRRNPLQMQLIDAAKGPDFADATRPGGLEI
ncbi:MAG: hypothetical protein HC813_02400 [Planctomycetes bacterium]|nr:hypothetical protein [Planctomycetota bacterium]